MSTSPNQPYVLPVEHEQTDELAEFREYQKQILERFEDPAYLPSRQEVFDAFPSSTSHLDTYRKPNTTGVITWRDYCDREGNTTFEFLTQEFISILSDYIAAKYRSLGLEREPLRVLEIGSGNGRLTHFLKTDYESRHPNARAVEFLAEDTPGEDGWGIERDFPVEEIDYKEALEIFEPHLVISSWMPPRTDFSQAIRDTKSVEEYLLIGEPYGGCCGDPQKTWGTGYYDEPIHDQVPYERDGFTMQELHRITETQICRPMSFEFASPDQKASATVSFTRDVH